MNCRNTIPVRLALLALVTAGAVSCANNIPLQDAAPVRKDISQGNIFVQLVPIEIAEGKAAVYFQAGRVIAEEGIGADDPVCRLEPVGPARTKLTTMQPQRFRVTSVDYDDRAPGGAGEQLSTTSITLSAENGSDKERISCWWPGAASRPDFVTPDDIGATLDGNFSIEVLN